MSDERSLTERVDEAIDVITKVQARVQAEEKACEGLSTETLERLIEAGGLLAVSEVLRAAIGVAPPRYWRKYPIVYARCKEILAAIE